MKQILMAWGWATVPLFMVFREDMGDWYALGLGAASAALMLAGVLVLVSVLTWRWER